MTDDLERRVEVLELAVLALGQEEFGDTPGHDFRGNQYTGGSSPGRDKREREAAKYVTPPVMPHDSTTSPKTLMNRAARAQATARSKTPFPRGPKPKPGPGGDPLEEAPPTPAQRRAYHV